MRLRQHFDGDLPIQFRIVRPVDLAHPTCTEQGRNFVAAEPSALSERHAD
jgi:hypothetical protein